MPVEAAPASAGIRAGIRITPNQRRFLDILRDAIADAPADLSGTATVPSGIPAVTRDILKKCCVTRGWLEEPEGNKGRAKFSEMLNTLAGKRLIGVTDRYVWIA